MNGHVDDEGRALIPIRVAASDGSEPQEFLAWIDTAFNGSLVLPKSKVKELQLLRQSTAEAVLADGNKVELETFGCVIEWFGKQIETQIVSNNSVYGLVGTMLLARHRLEIDYEHGAVSID